MYRAKHIQLLSMEVPHHQGGSPPSSIEQHLLWNENFIFQSLNLDIQCYNTGTWIFFVNFEVLHQKTPITTYIYFIFCQYFILASVRKLEHSPSLGSGIRPSRLRQPSTHSVSIVRSTALVKSATLESFLVPIAHKQHPITMTSSPSCNSN